jgi:hypothetical protein
MGFCLVAFCFLLWDLGLAVICSQLLAFIYLIYYIHEPSHAYFISKSEALWLELIGIGNCEVSNARENLFYNFFSRVA